MSRHHKHTVSSCRHTSYVDKYVATYNCSPMRTGTQSQPHPHTQYLTHRDKNTVPIFYITNIQRNAVAEAYIHKWLYIKVTVLTEPSTQSGSSCLITKPQTRTQATHHTHVHTHTYTYSYRHKHSHRLGHRHSHLGSQTYKLCA